MGVESSGGRGSVGFALPGQEGSSVRIKKGCDNQHAVGGHMARHSCGGGMASTMNTIRNNVPRTSRRRRSAILCKDGCCRAGQGGGNKVNNDGGIDGGGDVIALAITRAGIGWRIESMQREVDDAVITAARMLLRGGRAVDSATKGGADDVRRLCWYGDNTNDVWDLLWRPPPAPPPPAPPTPPPRPGSSLSNSSSLLLSNGSERRRR